MTLSFLVSFPLTFGALFSKNLFLCNTLFLHNTLFIRSKVLFHNICCFSLHMSLHTLLSHNTLFLYNTLFIRSKVLFYNICCFGLHMPLHTLLSRNILLSHNNLFIHNTLFIRSKVLFYNICCYGLHMSLHTLFSRNILLSHNTLFIHNILLPNRTLFIRSKVLFYNICCLSLHMSRSDSEISSLMVLQHFVLTKPLFWYNICYDRTFVLLARLCPTVTEMVRFEYRTFVLQQQMLSKNKVLHLLPHCLVDLFEHYSKLLGRLTTLYESVA